MYMSAMKNPSSKYGGYFLTVLGKHSVSLWGNSPLFLKAAFEMGKIGYILKPIEIQSL